MYNDFKTAHDRLTIKRTAYQPSTRVMWLLATVALFCLIMAGRSDFQAVQAGLI